MDDEKPRRRRRAAAAVALEPERGLIMRVLLHSPKDTLAAAAALSVVIAIMINALVLQAGRHPSPMFGATPIAAPSTPAPLPRMRPAETELRQPEIKPPETPAAPSKPPAAAANG